MSKLEQNISLLESKILRLIKELDFYKEEYARLTEEVSDLMNEKASFQDTLSQYENQQKITKIVTSLSESTPQSQELKLNLEEYIRVIDKCIKHISEQ